MNVNSEIGVGLPLNQNYDGIRNNVVAENVMMPTEIINLETNIVKPKQGEHFTTIARYIINRRI